MNEFELIDRFIEGLGELTQGEFIVAGPGDDGAVLDVPDGLQLVVSTDALVSGVHFPDGLRGDFVGYRSIAVNVSDLAAMAASPMAVTIALTVDSVELSWLDSFLNGVKSASLQYGLKVIGGNLAKGPLNVTVTVYGTVPKGEALLRSGSHVGDDIWLTGKVGATHAFLKSQDVPTQSLDALLDEQDVCPTIRYLLPHARTSFSESIREIAHAAIDVSDGLASEVAHMTRHCDLGAEIQLDRLPVWAGADPVLAAGADDSYELLFTAEPSVRDQILTAAQDTNTPAVVLGTMVKEPGLRFWLNDLEIQLELGYDHFM